MYFKLIGILHINKQKKQTAKLGNHISVFHRQKINNSRSCLFENNRMVEEAKKLCENNPESVKT